MLKLKIKNLCIQQIKVEKDQITEPREIEIKDVDIELNEREAKVYEEIIKKIENHLQEIGKEWKGDQEILDEGNIRSEMLNNDEEINENQEEIEEVNNEYNRKRNNKRKRIEEDWENKGEKKRKMSPEYWKLLRELTTPVEEEIENEVQEENREETLTDLLRKALKTEKRSIEEWFECGKKFVEEIEQRNRKRKSNTNRIRGKIYSELENEFRNYSRQAIRKRLLKAEWTYELFKGIGIDKIGRLRECTITDIKECGKEGIEKLIEKVNTRERRRQEMLENEMEE
jgi:hypothetical protein